MNTVNPGFVALGALAMFYLWADLSSFQMVFALWVILIVAIVVLSLAAILKAIWEAMAAFGRFIRHVARS